MESLPPESHAVSGCFPRLRAVRADRSEWRRKKKKREEPIEETVHCSTDCGCSDQLSCPAVGDSLTQCCWCDMPDTPRGATVGFVQKYNYTTSIEMPDMVNDPTNYSFLDSRDRVMECGLFCCEIDTSEAGIIQLPEYKSEFTDYFSHHLLQEFSEKGQRLSGINLWHFLLCAFVVVSCVTSPAEATSAVSSTQDFTTLAAPMALESQAPSTASTLPVTPHSSLAPNPSTPYLVTYTTSTPTDYNSNNSPFPNNSSMDADYPANGTASVNKTDILLGYITTLTYPEHKAGAEGRKISGAMTHAVDVINKDPSVLPNHRLKYVLGDNRGTELHSLDVITGE